MHHNCFRHVVESIAKGFSWLIRVLPDEIETSFPFVQSRDGLHMNQDVRNLFLKFGSQTTLDNGRKRIPIRVQPLLDGVLGQ